MIFNKDMRPKIKAENPAKSFDELAKAVSERWKNLNATEKKEYEDKAVEAKEKYKSELEARGESEKEKKEKVAKRPKTAFQFFSTAKRAEIKTAKPDIKPQDLTKEVTDSWKGLSTADKKPYEDQAKEAKETFKAPAKEKSKPPAKKSKTEEEEEEEESEEEDE